MSMNNNVNIEKKETAASAEKIDKIVICDDDKDIVRALQIYLSNRNYELLCAYTGREALDFVKKGDVSLVLLDIMMPEMDGITALRAIREKSNVPVILITAKRQKIRRNLMEEKLYIFTEVRYTNDSASFIARKGGVCTRSVR